jgi:tellurite resistance protein
MLTLLELPSMVFIVQIGENMKTENRLQHMPISFFSLVMGMAGLSIGWEKACEAFQFSSVIYNILLLLTLIIFIVLSGMYLFKAIYFKQSMVKEWSNPVKINFIPTISISLLLFAIAFLPIAHQVSRVFWIIGACLHLIITLHVVNSWLHHERYEIHHMNPAWFIPAVGNVVVPLAGVPLGYSDISWFFFSIGLFFWIILLVIVFNRIIFHQPMPQKLIPTLFILIAPPAVGFLSYIKLTGTLDTFSLLLYNFALFLTLLLFSQWPRFIGLPFFMSWWAYSFPLAAISIASMVMSHITGQIFYGYLGLSMLIFLSVLVCVLLVKTVKAAKLGNICKQDD